MSIIINGTPMQLTKEQFLKKYKPKYRTKAEITELNKRNDIHPPTEEELSKMASEVALELYGKSLDKLITDL
jgi:hypothetical protein